MTQDNYALLTRTGRLKEAQRMAGQAVPAITHMAFGDLDRSPTGGETALGHEVYRTALTGWGVYQDRTAAYFDCYLPAAVGGFVIREVGLFDAAGALVAIARRSPGLPKTAPDDGGGDDFTLRIDVFFEDLDTLVVQVSPIAGITADNLHLFLFPNNLPVEAVLSSAPGSPIDRGQWIVAPAPTGIWAGRAHQIARYRNGAWSYESPRAGRVATYLSGTRLVTVRFDGEAWAEWLATPLAAGPARLATSTEIRDRQGDGVVTAASLPNVRSSKESFGSVRLLSVGGVLKLIPFYGNSLLIRDDFRSLPDVGVSLPAAPSAANNYYIYAYWTGSAIALEASGTAPVQDPVTLQMRKAGDGARAYVGIARSAAAGGGWEDAPLVASHYNALLRVNRAIQPTGQVYTTTAYTEIPQTRIDFISDDGFYQAIGQATVRAEETVTSNNPPHIRMFLDGDAADSAAPRIENRTFVGCAYFASSTALPRGFHQVSARCHANDGVPITVDNIETILLTYG